MKGTAAAWFGSLVLHANGAPAEPTWAPGNPTASTLPGEVEGADERGLAGGVYGRFDGDIDLSLSAGAELATDPSRALARVAAHYYWMAGPYLSLRAPLSDDGSWLASTGIDVKPVFIPRWAMNLEQGPAFVDLLIDSLSVSAGAFTGLGESEERSRATGFELGLGAGIPLLATAPGPWLEARYLLSWRHAGAASASVWLSLSWHLMVDTWLASKTRG